MNSVNRKNAEFNEIEIVYTCNLCETICNPDEVRNHPCLEGYSNYVLDKNNYFYPQCNNGSIVRKSLIGGQEVFVEEEVQQENSNQEEAELIEDGNSDSNRPISLYAKKIRNEEFLIEEVRKRPPLWNFKLHISERGVRAKEKLWEEIADSMKGEMTLIEIKKKWKSLSDMFRRHRKTHKQPSGSAAAKKVKWLHFERLSFLHDMQRENETTSNIADLSNSPDVSLDGMEYTDDRSDSTSQNSKSQGENLETDILGKGSGEGPRVVWDFDPLKTPPVSRRVLCWDTRETVIGNDSRREKTSEPGVVDRMVDMLNEPVTVDVAGGLPNDEFTGFGMVVASKLRALSADAGEVAMLAILQLLREARANDQ